MCLRFRDFHFFKIIFCHFCVLLTNKEPCMYLREWEKIERIWNGSPSSHFYFSPTRPSQPLQKMVMFFFFNLCSFYLWCFQVFLFRAKPRSCRYVVIIIHLFFLFILTFVILITRFIDVFIYCVADFITLCCFLWWEESTIAAVFFSQARAVNDAMVTFDIYDCYVVWYEKLCI